MDTRRPTGCGSSFRNCLVWGIASWLSDMLTDLSVRGNVIGIVQVQFVDLVLGHELVDVDRALALDRDSFELLGIKLDIFTLSDLIALDDICRIHLIGRFGIDLAVLDTVAGFLIELMEADLLALGGDRLDMRRGTA
jgi:hypothetical protein